MKKRVIIGALASAAILLGIFYACKKTDGSKISKEQDHPARTAQRSAGVVTYYSKDSDGIVYKMVLTTRESGVVDIDRSVYATNKPDTFKTKVFVGEGVYFTNRVFNPDSNKYYGDTIGIAVPMNRTSYIIPFIPAEDPVLYVQAVEYYCECGCIECDAQYGCLQNGDETSSECLGVCDICKAIANGCPPTLRVVPDVGGHVIIEAKGINVIN